MTLCFSSATASPAVLAASVLTLTEAVALIHNLFDGLLPYAVVAEVIELLELVVELTLLHLVVHLRDQVLEGLLHVRRVESTGLQEVNLCFTKRE